MKCTRTNTDKHILYFPIKNRTGRVVNDVVNTIVDLTELFDKTYTCTNLCLCVI